MKALRLLVLLVMAAVLASCSSTSTQNAADVSVLIMNGDADMDSVPRHNRASDRVLNAVADQIQSAGFRVYDETSVTLDNYQQGRSRRSDAELLDIARSVTRPQIDVAVIYSLYVNTRDKAYSTQLDARLSGKMVNVQTGRILGVYELELPRSIRVADDCVRGCLVEALGKEVDALANDLGAVLAEKLEDVAVSKRRDDSRNNSNTGSDRRGMVPAYELVLDGFSPNEQLEIEDALTDFREHRSHRVVYSGERRAEYWFEVDMSSAKLNRLIRLTLQDLALRGAVRFSGNRFEISKITSRQSPRVQPSGDYEW